MSEILVYFGLLWRGLLAYYLFSLDVCRAINGFRWRVLGELILSTLILPLTPFLWYLILVEVFFIFCFYLRTRLIELADILLEGVDEVSHYSFSIGTNYFSLGIRKNVIFGFLGLRKFRVFVATRDYTYSDSRVSWVDKCVSRFVRAKKLGCKEYDGIKLIVFRGAIMFFDPEKQLWKKLTGKFAIIEF